jgi:hypothetical protein
MSINDFLDNVKLVLDKKLNETQIVLVTGNDSAGKPSPPA